MKRKNLPTQVNSRGSDRSAATYPSVGRFRDAVGHARTAVAQAVRGHFHVVKAAGRRVLALRVTLGRVVGPRGRFRQQADSRAHGRPSAAAVGRIAARQRLEAARQAADVAEHDLLAAGRGAARERPGQPYAAAGAQEHVAAGARVQQPPVHTKGLCAAAAAESQTQRVDLQTVAAVGRERDVVDRGPRRHRGLVHRVRPHELHALVDARTVAAVVDGARGPLEPRHVRRLARVVVDQKRESASRRGGRARDARRPHPRPRGSGAAVRGPRPHVRAQLVRERGQPPEVHRLEAACDVRLRRGRGPARRDRDRLKHEDDDDGRVSGPSRTRVHRDMVYARVRVTNNKTISYHVVRTYARTAKVYRGRATDAPDDGPHGLYIRGRASDTWPRKALTVPTSITPTDICIRALAILPYFFAKKKEKTIYSLRERGLF